MITPWDCWIVNPFLKFYLLFLKWFFAVISFEIGSRQVLALDQVVLVPESPCLEQNPTPFYATVEVPSGSSFRQPFTSASRHGRGPLTAPLPRKLPLQSGLRADSAFGKNALGSLQAHRLGLWSPWEARLDPGRASSGSLPCGLPALSSHGRVSSTADLGLSRFFHSHCKMVTL